MYSRLWLLACVVLLAAPAHAVLHSGTVYGTHSEPLPFANVTAPGCRPESTLTDATGAFSVDCTNLGGVAATVWARQYLNRSVALPAGTHAHITLEPRPIPGFPATDWVFEGWAIEAQTGNVPGTDVSFLAHPSAYRTPSGRIFMISTANSHAGPGWTQAYWQEPGSVVATAIPGPLLDGSHPVIDGTPFSARMLVADGRLLMTVGMQSGRSLVCLLENKNLADPSNPSDWVAAEGDGHIHVDFTGAPTAQHEDYRLHVFDDMPQDFFGRRRRYWLFVIPDGASLPGRACGRLAFTAESLTGPYTYSGWLVGPGAKGPPAGGPTSNCDSWPGDVIALGNASYFFVGGWGNIYTAAHNGHLNFTRLPGYGVVSEPAPSPAYDDFRQIEFTFLPPASPGGRWRMYHASYSKENGNANATRADYGYKQAIGMYTFSWPH